MSTFDRDGKHYGFTQPLCVNCWIEEYPGRAVVRTLYPHRQAVTCCMCGTLNADGIFTRRDPEGVPYPQPEEDA